jgi:hypothetical protein
MNRFPWTLLLATVIPAGAAWAADINDVLPEGAPQITDFSADLSSRSVHIGFDGLISQSNARGTGTAVEAGALFHSQDQLDFNEGYLGIKAVGSQRWSNVRFNGNIGLRGIYFSGAPGDGEALALQAAVEARPLSLRHLGLAAGVVYAPDPLTFGDGHQYFQFDFTAAYDVTRNVAVYAGYRNISVDFGAGGRTVDNGWLGGVRLAF